MIGTLEKTVLDCPDPRALAEFYAELLGMQVNEDGGDWVVIGRHPGARDLAFQRAPTWRPPTWPDPAVRQHAHLDIRVADIDEAERAVTALGARRVPGPGETGFRVFLDPVGHPFCLVFGHHPQQPPPAWSKQDEADLRFDWGQPGVAATSPGASTVIIVDVLRFTTAVEAGVRSGGLIYPYRWRDASAATFAMSVGAVLAHEGGPTGPSLSPASLAGLPGGARVVLPSPNGSTCAALAAEAGATVVAGCLRNASAVADWAGRRGGPISVVAAGERWVDGSMRPALEDLIGAGAILAACPGEPSPEARSTIGAFAGMKEGLGEVLGRCASARELSEKGYAADVAYALEIDASDVVPVLRDGAFGRAD